MREAWAQDGLGRDRESEAEQETNCYTYHK
jgi:hypothetical protein